MNSVNHCAVDIAADCNYNWVVAHLIKNYFNLQNLSGALFSPIAINKIIEEELLHDKFEITSVTNSNLKSMSSGEQKKALLQFIINKKPDFIILDNVLDNLDAASQKDIVATLNGIAAHTVIIQIINRKKDILPFIEKVYWVKNNSIVKEQSLAAYLQEHNIYRKNIFIEKISPPLHRYALPANPLIQLQNVNVSYIGRQILNNISWAINAREFWQLIGANGSGKSTLLSLITGDNPKAYGQNIILFGMKKGSGETIWDIKQNIGYLNTTMVQFFPRLDSIEKMILSGFFDSIGLYIMPNETQIKTAQQWLKVIGMFKERNTAFCFLPLSKQRMVLVARAMVKHPPVLILDEPTNGLNDTDALIFVSLINKIAKESTTAIVFVSHSTEEGLTPQFIFELVPTENGSVGRGYEV